MNAVRTHSRRISRSFSRAAHRYEKLSAVQEDIGRGLLERVSPGEPACVLDVGMGTGRLTDHLGKKFPGARVVGIDLAEGMVRQARTTYGSFTSLQADACALPFRDDVFGRVVSNGCYQWAWDLGVAFGQAYRVLAPGGKISVALFGRETLKELSAAFAAGSAPVIGPRGFLRSLPSADDVLAAVRACGFDSIRVERELRKVHFADMLSLLRWLKGTGTNISPSGLFVGRNMLARCAQYYEQHYQENNRVYATFEVLWMTGEKNDR